MVGIVVVRCFIVICESLVLPTGAFLAQVGGRSGCHCVMGGLLASIQERTQKTVVQSRSILQGESFWHILFAETKYLMTWKPTLFKPRGHIASGCLSYCCRRGFLASCLIFFLLACPQPSFCNAGGFPYRQDISARQDIFALTDRWEFSLFPSPI